MPIYEYRCAQCGKKFEKLRGMRDSDEGVECPECRSSKVDRQFSGFATSGGGSPSPGCSPRPGRRFT